MEETTPDRKAKKKKDKADKEKVEDETVLEGKEESIPTSRLLSLARGNLGNSRGHILMAILIYGMVIFPKRLQHVDRIVLDVVEQALNGFNPIPAILAETIRSLSFYRKNGRGRFQAYAQLLTIWFRSHLWDAAGRFRKSFRDDRETLTEYCEVEWEEKTKQEWTERLKTFESKDVLWKA